MKFLDPQLLNRFAGATGLAFVRVASQAFQFLLFLYAARVLSTADFGIFSMAYAVVLGLTVVAEAGWREYVICCDEPDEVREASTVALASGATMSLLGMVGLGLAQVAGTAGAFGGIGLMLLPWVLLRPLTVVQVGVLTRDGRLGAVAAVQWSAELASFAAGALALWLGQGVIALAWGKLALLVVELGGYAVCNHRLAFRVPDRAAVRRMVVFSREILSARVLSYLQGNFTTLAIGVFFNAAAVGIYRAATRLSGTAQEVIREPARFLGWSWLRRARDADEQTGADGTAFESASMQFLEIVLSLGAALLALMAVMAHPLIHVLLGAKWNDAVVLLTLLCIGGMTRLVSTLTDPIFPLLGKPRLTRTLAILTTVASVFTFALALPFGIVAVAASDIVAGILALGVAVFFLVKEGGIRVSQLLVVAIPSVLAVLAVFAAGAAVGELPQFAAGPNLINLVAEGLLLAAVYGVTLAAGRFLIPRGKFASRPIVA